MFFFCIYYNVCYKMLFCLEKFVLMVIYGYLVICVWYFLIKINSLVVRGYNLIKIKCVWFCYIIIMVKLWYIKF